MSIESLKALFRPELDQLSAYRVPPAPPAVRLDANESPWPLPPEARARIAAILHTSELHRYPDGRATTLRNALARGLGGSADEYVLGAGSDELIALMATAMCRPRSRRRTPGGRVPGTNLRDVRNDESRARLAARWRAPRWRVGPRRRRHGGCARAHKPKRRVLRHPPTIRVAIASRETGSRNSSTRSPIRCTSSTKRMGPTRVNRLRRSQRSDPTAH